MAQANGVDAEDTAAVDPASVDHQLFDDEIAADQPSVGSRLRSAREALGLSLQDVCDRTKVTIRHLEAIEAGAFRNLPGKPYAVGFSRSYAQAVGLNRDEIADAVRAELLASEPVQPHRVIHQFEIGEAEKTPSPQLAWLAAAVAVGVLVAGLFAWRSFYWPAAGLPPVEAPAVTVVRAPAPTAPAPVAMPQPASGEVKFTALEDGVWVKFYDQTGKQLLQKRLTKGEIYVVPADVTGPRIWSGRPDALAITIGGQVVPKLSDVEVTMKDVPVSAEALLGRVAQGQAQVQAALPAPAPGPVPRLAPGPVPGPAPGQPSTATM